MAVAGRNGGLQHEPFVHGQGFIAKTSEKVSEFQWVCWALVHNVAQCSHAVGHVVACGVLCFGGPGDTLQALYRHTKISPLDYVGNADITAHVDFLELASLARAADLACQGPVSQGMFLSHLGLQARAQALINANPACANDVRLAVERLVSEAHMGGLFSVICIDSPHNDGRGPPLGF